MDVFYYLIGLKFNNHVLFNNSVNINDTPWPRNRALSSARKMSYSKLCKSQFPKREEETIENRTFARLWLQRLATTNNSGIQ